MYLFLQMFARSIIHCSGRGDNPFNIRPKALQLRMLRYPYIVSFIHSLM